MRLKVGCYQCRCAPGDLEANLVTIKRGLVRAAEEGVEILAYPESLLTGYYTDEAKARENAFALESPEIDRFLELTRDFDGHVMVGFNEMRGDEIYNTVVVAERGSVLGTYSKAFPVFSYFTPGRDFQVFNRKGLTYGVIICADGAFIEPTRILALKGADLVIAPHYNFLKCEWVVIHHQMVRHDHVARAVENGIWFMRPNNIGEEFDAGLDHHGVGYGDSYLLDPLGQIAAHAGLQNEDLMTGVVDTDRNFYRRRAWESRISARELGGLLMETMEQTES